MRIYKITLLIFCSLFFNKAFAQTELETVDKTLSRNDFTAHIEFLASDELRGRDTGSPEIDIAAKYLATQLKSYGAKSINGSYFQKVELRKRTFPKTMEFSIDGEIFKDLILFKGADLDLQTNAVFLNYGSAADFKKNVKGKVVIVIAGSAEGFDISKAFEQRAEKRELAKEYGAVGLIELAPIESSIWSRLVNYFSGTQIGLAEDENSGDNSKEFPHLWMMDSDGAIANKLKPGKKVKSTLKIDGIIDQKIPGKNVVGVIEGSDPKLKDEFVVYSAHYDHLGVGQADADGDSIYNGARDNVVGTVTVLSVAKNLGKYPTKRSALFVFFTGEEKGLLGSSWFAEHSPIPLNQLVYCFNSDNAAYNDTSIATVIGLDKTTAKALIVQGVEAVGLKVGGDPAPEQGLYGRSDHANFAKKGVPAILFSLGVKAFDEEITRTYHQTNDNAETLDYNYLEKFFRAYVLTSRLIANAEEAPFWSEGDEYYEVGKELYNKESTK